MFAFHHVRNVFDSPGQKPGFRLLRERPRCRAHTKAANPVKGFLPVRSWAARIGSHESTLSAGLRSHLCPFKQRPDISARMTASVVDDQNIGGGAGCACGGFGGIQAAAFHRPKGTVAILLFWQRSVVTDFAISARKIGKSWAESGFPIGWEMPSRPLTGPAGAREIVNHLI